MKPTRQEFEANKEALHKIAKAQASLVMTADQYLNYLKENEGSDALLGSVYVDGDLTVDHKMNLEMTSLTGLSGSLNMEGCERCVVGAAIIGKDFNAEKAAIIETPNLRIIGGRALLSRSSEITAPEIEGIDGPLDLREADDITSRIKNEKVYIAGKVYEPSERYRSELIC
jgi:hypothetical protein